MIIKGKTPRKKASPKTAILDEIESDDGGKNITPEEFRQSKKASTELKIS